MDRPCHCRLTFGCCEAYSCRLFRIDFQLNFACPDQTGADIVEYVVPFGDGEILDQRHLAAGSASLEKIGKLIRSETGLRVRL